jgi:hypothetical protein
VHIIIPTYYYARISPDIISYLPTKWAYSDLILIFETQEEASVRDQGQDVRLAGLVNPNLIRLFQLFSRLVRFFDKTIVIAEFEVHKLRHDPTELITRAVQSALWLLVFGGVFTRARAIPTHTPSTAKPEETAFDYDMKW